jgi:hypothetical protein
MVAKLIGIHAKIRQKEKSLLALDNPLFTPRSARIGFTLTGSAQIRESPRFKELAAAAETTVTHLQQQLATNIKSVIELELQMLKDEKAKAILLAIVEFAKLELISDAKEPTAAQILIIPLAALIPQVCLNFMK